MNIFVFGVGRSGTTVTYALAQKIAHRESSGRYLSTYEPFLWSMDAFNCSYEDAKPLFGKLDSLSIEGIYRHLQLPMFPGADAVSADFTASNFAGRFRPYPGYHVAKLIRGNGRMAMFRALNPTAKFILILRNPIDVMNSAKGKFAFYGDDFYPSDYPRFCAELAAESQLLLEPATANWAQMQAEYCYQMSRSALEFAAGDDNSMVVEYEQLASDSQSFVPELCRFLGVEFTPEFVEFLAAPTGPVTRNISLHESEYHAALPYDSCYRDLLSKFGIACRRSIQDIEADYADNWSSKQTDTSLDGVTTNRLRREVAQREQQIAQLKRRLQES